MNFRKMALLIFGSVSLLFGTVGIFLPILPTTPFLLLSAGCFSVSSPRLSGYLKNNKYFGSYLENYQNKAGVPRILKYRTILFLWVGLIVSMLITRRPLVIALLCFIGIAVSIHLLTMKTRE